MSLNENDYAQLEKCFITREIAESAKLERVTSEQGKMAAGRHDYEDYAGILYPYVWPGEKQSRAVRLRRDNPPVEIKGGLEVPQGRYLSAPGWGNPLYFHPDTPPAALNDVAVELFVTEGQKKCLALYRLMREAKLPGQPVALNGVWGHRGRTGIHTRSNGSRVQSKGVIPDFGRIEWSGRKVTIVFDANTEKSSVAAARNDLALELSSRGAHVYLADLSPEDGVNGIDDFLGIHGVRPALKLLDDAREFDPSEKISKLHLTDLGNEMAFETLFGEDFRYSHTSKEWMKWGGVVWEPDQLHAADRAMLEAARKRLDSCSLIANEEDRKRSVKKAFELENVSGRKSALESARSNPRFACCAEDFNRDDLLFACSNGVLDLERGEFRPGRRSDMLTVRSQVEWNPSASCAEWTNFLRGIFPEQTEEMLDFLQRAAGYSMTGSTREEIFFILHGTGRNGKGTFLRILSEVLGGYAGNADFSALIQDRDKGKAPRNDIAAFAGKRFITAQETKESAKFDESLIKSLTGGDLITARFLYKEFFTIRPTWKIWLATNHRPEIDGGDSGIWSRPKLIPFNVSFEGKEDKGLKARLLNPSCLSAILKWSYDGARLYVKDGKLSVPSLVTDATAEYKSESDVMLRFFDECCRQHEDLSARARSLYQSFSKWSESVGIRTITETAFGLRMKEKGFKKIKESYGFVYQGIAKAPGSDDQNLPYVN